MWRRLVSRLAQAVVIVAIVATVTFLLVHLAPGDPFGSQIDERAPSPAIRERLRAQYGLDQPLTTQYVRWVSNLARGEMGWSFTHNEPVATLLVRTLPNTLLLTGTALVLSFVVGIALGVIQAVAHGRLLGRVLDTLTVVVASLPEFWLAIALVLLFAVRLRLFPASGMANSLYDYLSPAEKISDRLKHLALPVATLTLLFACTIAQYQRAALLEVLPEEFVRAARSRGLTERRVILRHALRNALSPIASLAGLALPLLVGGVVFIEQVFAWPGMGQLALVAATGRDYEVVTAAAVVGAAVVAAGSVLTELLHAALDPRLRDS